MNRSNVDMTVWLLSLLSEVHVEARKGVVSSILVRRLRAHARLSICTQKNKYTISIHLSSKTGRGGKTLEIPNPKM